MTQTRAHDGWINLGRYSPALQQRLEGGHAPSEGVITGSPQFYAAGARNAQILGI